ncbi:SGNH/GDSL hydrolase family protein [Prauserella muralis]|uniref:SGNH hydrolase n=1 Tax=Prauserella muralis TaxID=588067 RepID=A0A2V4ALX1_9PSEU|nr:SGNH/GDSL hydrolase family protein [Prauserella muralis]PXY21298.1 SGNH hydrolase [Prauserella muralis]TWE30419.1 lysophospholipase L1-like esterase [Prauserella muralis]
MGYQRFVALGDSCTEGLDDPYPGRQVYRGWADLVASHLARDEPGLRYANLGVRGRRLDQIVVEQIPTAIDLRPDLVALFGGGNDIMITRAYSTETVTKRVRAAVRLLCDAAPTVVVFTLSDISGRMPGLRRMRERIDALNDAIRTAAADYGAVLVDLWPDEAAQDLRYFGPDRLHLGEHGHRRVAAHLLRTLGVPYDGSWLEPLPGSPAEPNLLAHARWMWSAVLPSARTRVTNFLTGRSSGDGYLPKRPDLLPVLSDERDPWAAIPGSI